MVRDSSLPRKSTALAMSSGSEMGVHEDQSHGGRVGRVVSEGFLAFGPGHGAGIHSGSCYLKLNL